MVFESPPHSVDGEDVEFRLLERELRTKFPDRYLIDHASKAPHKLPAHFDPGDEKAIALINRDGDTLNFNQESEIIRRIVAPISKYRVYAHPDIADAVAATCKDFHREARPQRTKKGR